jgi:iron-sulfur cluster assembly protein
VAQRCGRLAHKELLAKSEKPIASVRVGVKNGGCAGMAYTMEYAECVEPADEIVEDKGVRILIDPKAVLFLLGTEMDYKVEKIGGPVRVQQPEPDVRLRLRRIGDAGARERNRDQLMNAIGIRAAAAAYYCALLCASPRQRI